MLLHGFAILKESSENISCVFQVNWKINLPKCICVKNVRMRENTDENNSQYGHFLRSGYLREIHFKCINK